MPGDVETRASKQAGIETALTAIQGQLKELIARIKTVENNVNIQGEKMSILEELVKENQELRREIGSVKADNIGMKKKLRELEDNFEDILIDKNRNKIELVGVQQEQNEVLIEVVKNIGNLAKLKLNEKDVKRVFRSKPRGQKAGTIILEFEETRTRDIYMKEVKRVKPKNEDLGAGGKSKIFVNENLTRKAKNILYHVKQEAYQRKWNRTWTFGGIVHVKIRENDNPIKIRSLEDLEILVK